MSIKVGDKVKFLNDVGGGEVTEIIDYSTVRVLTDDGFEFPHLLSDLVIIESENKDSFFNVVPESKEPVKSIEEQIFNDEQLVVKDNEDVNIYFAFVPENQNKPTESRQSLYLINDSNWHLLFVYQIRRIEKYDSFPGFLQPNYIEQIKTFELSEINEIKEIVLQIIFFRKIPYDVKKPLIISTKINPAVFYKSSTFRTNEFFEEKALIIPMMEENPLAKAVKKIKKDEINKVVKEKEIENLKINQPKKFKTPPKEELIEIDLHLVELLDDAKNMTPSEMLDFQMSKFKEELEKAQKTHHIKKAVFIHGKGNGTLKTKIRAYLDLNKINYQDASFQKYGFGATLVFV